MVNCPDCGKSMEADFGMTTCPHCSAVFMVEFDGTINQGDSAQEPEEVTPQSEEQIFEEEAPTVAEEDYSEDFLDSMSEDTSENSSEAESSATLDPLGIQKFDQSKESELVDGPFLYDVVISGLDTLQIKKDVLQALSDKRFGFTEEEIKKKIKAGELLLDGLNPVKAVLVVLKVQDFDIEISWTQKHYTSEIKTSEVTKESET